MADPSKAVGIKKGIGDIHTSIQHHFESQACPGIDPRDPNSLAQSIVQNGCFNSSQLHGVGDFIFPIGLLQLIQIAHKSGEIFKIQFIILNLGRYPVLSGIKFFYLKISHLKLSKKPILTFTILKYSGHPE
jgi:hypothetical protein